MKELDEGNNINELENDGTKSRRRKCNRAFSVGLLQKALVALLVATVKALAYLVYSFFSSIGTLKKASSFFIGPFSTIGAKAY